jgi:hypothetical protein
MRAFDIDILPREGSWLIKVGGRVLSGAATRERALRIARLAAETMTRSGYEVRLAVASGDGAPASQQLLVAGQQATA